MSSTTVSAPAAKGSDIPGQQARRADSYERTRTTVLVGSGRAHELAKLLGTVARPDGVASGHVLTAPNGRWEIRVVPDGSVELWSSDGGAVLRGQLAAPSVVAAMVTAGEVVEVDGNTQVVRSAAVEWRATAWFRPCVHRLNPVNAATAPKNRLTRNASGTRCAASGSCQAGGRDD